ncbi:MAG: hypothetical protein P8174_04510 [Gemmatimonadota bacterium]
MVATAFVLTGCSKSSTTAPTTGNPDLVGNYSLVSIMSAAFGGLELKPPVATGTMTMADSTYTVDITIAVPGQDTIPVQDMGTYTVSGDSITQNSSVQQIQSVGTYTLVNNTLTVDVTAAGQETKTVWNKQ